jgi:hypothetical protein
VGDNGLCGLPLVVIPEERVKAGRDIHQPLSDLAVEIAREAMGNYPWILAGRSGTEPLNRKAMACSLRGKTKRVKGKVVIESEGICRMLGLKPFTPHDLRRRIAASLMGSIKVPRSIISLCLDHTSRPTSMARSQRSPASITIRTYASMRSARPCSGWPMRSGASSARRSKRRRRCGRRPDQSLRAVNNPVGVKLAGSVICRMARQPAATYRSARKHHGISVCHGIRTLGIFRFATLSMSLSCARCSW